MRVLHILDHSLPLHSGYSFRTRAILDQQRLLGWETLHLTSSKHYGAQGPEEDIDGLHFFRTFPGNTLMNKLPVLNQLAVVRELALRLEQVVKQEDPDILHAHSPCLNGLAALQVGRRLGLPVVYELRASWEDAAVDHGSTREGSARYRVSRALETFVLKRVDAVTTICDGLCTEILARGVPTDKVTVIPNAVDVDRFRADGEPDPALITRLGLTGKRVLGFIGSFYAYEGLALLLEALPGMLRTNPEIRVLLVGGGPQEEDLKKLAMTLGVADQVIFAGRVPHEQVHGYYCVIDLLIYPRMPMRLTEMVTPLKPLEAMAQRRLLVASDVGGHRELIEDGKTGVLFKAGDADALARAVLKLLDEPARWPELRAAGRKFIETERTWQASVARYQAVYQRLLASTDPLKMPRPARPV